MIEIPKSFKDVLVKDYIKLRGVTSKDYDNPISKVIDVLSIFNDREEVLREKPYELNALAKETVHLYQEPNTTLEKYFKIKGKDYGIVTNIEELEAGQYISVVSLLKDLQDNPNLHYEIIHKILACVIFPVDKKKKPINIEPGYFQRLSNDIYETMSIDEAYPIAVFFCNLSESLTLVTQDYLSKKVTTMTDEATRIQLEVAKGFLEDGDGSLHSITSVIQILQNGNTSTK